MCSQDSIAHTNKELPGLSPQQQHAAANRMVIDDPGPDPRYHIIRQFSGPTTKMPPHSELWFLSATEYQLLSMVPSL